MLIHQLPPKPAYLRVKIWRRLQSLGAVALKNSVYVLPERDGAREDLDWLRAEIAGGGGEAVICRAAFLEGISDGQMRGLFAAARDADYAELFVALKPLARAARTRLKPARRAELAAELKRLKRRFEEIAAIDFFAAPGREGAAALIADIEEALRREDEPAPAPPPGLGSLKGRVWVTRRGVHIDRMACAWAVKRFIDPAARFKFVEGAYRPRAGEIRFDMSGGEISHVGERCSFETLIELARLDDPALAAIAEIVHDVDLKDGRFGRAETAGIGHLVAGIAHAHDDDEARLARSAALFDDLYASFKRRRG